MSGLVSFRADNVQVDRLVLPEGELFATAGSTLDLPASLSDAERDHALAFWLVGEIELANAEREAARERKRQEPKSRVKKWTADRPECVQGHPRPVEGWAVSGGRFRCQECTSIALKAA